MLKDYAVSLVSLLVSFAILWSYGLTPVSEFEVVKSACIVSFCPSNRHLYALLASFGFIQVSIW